MARRVFDRRNAEGNVELAAVLADARRFEVLDMDPAPDARLDTSPPAVVIRFTERVEPRASSLDVLDARGARVSRGDGVVDPENPWRYRVALEPLPPGAYTVSWRVLSADDGHVTSGAHVFTVGIAGPSGQSGSMVRSGGGWRPLARWLWKRPHR